MCILMMFYNVKGSPRILARVSAGILAKAALVGANTVKLVYVLAKYLSMPEATTALTSVVINGSF